MPGRVATAVACAAIVLSLHGASGTAICVAQSAADEVTADQVRGAIDTLGAFEFPRRMAAGRTVRRASAPIAVPALLRAVTSHTDEYVRFRALVILSGFNEPRTRDVMLKALADRNDRVRAVAYSWFEHNPDPGVLPRLTQALEKEESEFVRPALTRALAAYAVKDEPRTREAREALAGLVMKGQDLFRAAVIEAVGDYKGTYALKPIVEVAKLDGPLQDDAVLAIGRLGDKRGLEALAALQRTAPRTLQPTIAAAICLIGSNCASHQGYISETLKFGIANPGFQDLLRSAAAGLAALAVAGNAEAIDLLIQRGTPARDPERAAIALALGTVALRNTPLLLKALEAQTDNAGALELLREAFDMLEEDFEEERFFALVRRTYWQAAQGSPTRRVAESLIQRLEF
jgi:HEAT repeat protein